MAADRPVAPEIEAFARLLAVGVPAAEAYTKSGVGRALACSVSQAERHPDVIARLAHYKEHIPDLPKVRDLDDPELDPLALKREDVMNMLLRDRVRAHATGQINAAVNAGKLLGQEIGMFVDRAVTITAAVEIPDLELAQRIAYLLLSGEAGVPALLPSPEDKVTTINP